MSFPTILLWDSSFPLILLEGEGSRRFLQGQLTSEIISLEENKIIRTCWLSPVGAIKAILEIRLSNNLAEVLVLTGNFKDVFDGFDRVIFPSDKVTLKLERQVRRVQQISCNLSWQESYFEWFDVDKSLLEPFKNLKPANSIQFEEWRIKQGLPMNLKEINGKTNPFELGLSNLINLSKGCFLGQETLAKINNVRYTKQELRLFEVSSNISTGEKLLFQINNDTFESAGFITSYLKIKETKTIGLAIIRKKYLLEKELTHEKSKLQVKINLPIAFKNL